METKKVVSRLFNKNFSILWHSQLISQLGSQAFAVSMLFWVKHLTGSATLMGTLLMASMIPGVLLGPIGGVVADLYSRKKIIVWCDFISGISVLSFATLLFLMPDEHNLLLITLFVASLLVSISKAFFSPSVLAVIPDVVSEDKVPMANSFHQSSTQLSMLVGLGLGGLLYRLVGAPLLFLIDGISYLYAAIVQLFIDVPKTNRVKEVGFRSKLNNFKRQALEGLHHIRGDKGLSITFLLAALLNFFFGPLLVALPFFVEDSLKMESDWYGYLYASYGVGSIIGYFLVSAIKIGTRLRGYLIGMLLIMLAVLNYLLGHTTQPYVALGVVFLMGCVMGFVNITMINQLQITSKPEMRGRLFGNLTAITSAIMPISIGLSGVVIDMLDQRVNIIFQGCGILMLVVSLAIAFNKHILAFYTRQPVTEEHLDVKEEEAVEEVKDEMVEV